MIPLNVLTQLVSLETTAFFNFLLYSAGFLAVFVSFGIIKKIMKV